MAQGPRTLDPFALRAAVVEVARLAASYAAAGTSDSLPIAVADEARLLAPVLDALASFQNRVSLTRDKKHLLRRVDFRMSKVQADAAEILRGLQDGRITSDDALAGIVAAAGRAGFSLTRERLERKLPDLSPQWISKNRGPEEAAAYLVGWAVGRAGRYGKAAKAKLRATPLGELELEAIAHGGRSVGSIGIVKYFLQAMGFPPERVSAAVAVLFAAATNGFAPPTDGPLDPEKAKSETRPINSEKPTAPKRATTWSHDLAGPAEPTALPQHAVCAAKAPSRPTKKRTTQPPTRR